MADKKHFTAEQVAEALRYTKGMVFLASKRLGCSHATVYNYVNRYASVKAAKQAAEGEITDIAELKLIEAINAGAPWALQFQLKTKGKDRGYVERQEVTGKDGGPVSLQVVETIVTSRRADRNTDTPDAG